MMPEPLPEVPELPPEEPEQADAVTVTATAATHSDQYLFCLIFMVASLQVLREGCCRQARCGQR
jgi:hypothetical protein